MKLVSRSKFGPAGADLHRWLDARFDMEGAQPMVDHVCDLADVIEELKADVKKRGVVLKEGGRNPSVDASLKASAAFARAWRLLGLADAEKPAPKAAARAGKRA